MWIEFKHAKLETIKRIKINSKNITILVCILLGFIICGYLIIYFEFTEFNKVNNNLNIAKSKLIMMNYII